MNSSMPMKRKAAATTEIDLTQSDDDEEVQYLGVKPASSLPKIATKSPREDDEVEIVDVKPAPKSKVLLDDAVEIVGTGPATLHRKSSTKRSQVIAAFQSAVAKEVEFVGIQQASPPSLTTKRPANNRKLFSCAICMEDDIPGRDGFTLSCRHRFCKGCLSNLITNKIDDKAARDVGVECPAPKCKIKLSTSEVQYILGDDKQAFSRFATKANTVRLEREAVSRSSSTRRCPAEHCNFIFVFEPGTGAEGTPFECPSCQARFCLQCGANKRKVGPAHAGISCHERVEQLKQQAEERKKFEKWQKDNSQADQRFQDLLKKEQQSGKTMPCPSCKTPITKNGGCHHMRCTSCNKNFNWKGK